MKMSEYRLGFIGFGHMAQIMFHAIDGARIIPRSQVQFIQRDSAKMKRSEQKHLITSTSMERLISTSDILLLCVRPAQAEQALQQIAPLGAGDKMILSILAGVPLSLFQKHLGPQAQVIRVMPNVASAIGQGMTILSARHASVDFREAASMLLAPLGPSLEVPEPLMDAATGLAASSPGFVFKLIQALALQGEKEGLSPKDSLTIAAQVFTGAGQLVAKGGDPIDLMMQIATPGGVTEAGFQVMEKTELAKHFQETVQAAIRKAKQFSEEYK